MVFWLSEGSEQEVKLLPKKNMLRPLLRPPRTVTPTTDHHDHPPLENGQKVGKCLNCRSCQREKGKFRETRGVWYCCIGSLSISLLRCRLQYYKLSPEKNDHRVDQRSFNLSSPLSVIYIYVIFMSSFDFCTESESKVWSMVISKLSPPWYVPFFTTNSKFLHPSGEYSKNGWGWG